VGVEIGQLVVRSRVGGDEGGVAPSGGSRDEEREALLEACRRMMEELLERRRER